MNSNHRYITVVSRLWCVNNCRCWQERRRTCSLVVAVRGVLRFSGGMTSISINKFWLAKYKVRLEKRSQGDKLTLWSIDLDSNNLRSQVCFSSASTCSSWPSSKKTSRTLLITSSMTLWYRLGTMLAMIDQFRILLNSNQTWKIDPKLNAQLFAC